MMCLKEYNDLLLATTDDLGIQHIFTHADEVVNAKLLHIIWNHGNHFKKIIPFYWWFPSDNGITKNIVHATCVYRI